uniref:Uncharacterized protein n=2 Tax=Arthrobacter sp. 31.31 TaxID=347202 RepID=I3VZE3_9MICC|nr:hypothetical protein [Arthrobacter sp. 31.31]
MQQLLDRWVDGETVTLEEFGGPDVVLDAADALIVDDPLSLTEILCEYWEAFGPSQEQAVRTIVAAADADHPDMDAVHDALLVNEAVLPAVADALVNALSDHAQNDGLYGDIATETWTRLAIGDWCSSLEVRGHLRRRAMHVGAAATIHLVRSVGAAVNTWNDKELIEALTVLGSLDEFEADVHFELAMHQLGAACAATNGAIALDGIRATVEHLRITERWDDRVDARAYLTPLEALVRFASGGTVTADDVAEARVRVSEYLIGYHGLHRHWRQGHADVTAGWALLLQLLTDAVGAEDEHWFAPGDVIGAVASLYVAETSIELVARNSDTSPIVQTGVSALVRPRLVAAFSDHPPATGFLDRWLADNAARQETEPVLIGAVESLRAVVFDQGTLRPKDECGPGERRGSALPGTDAATFLADVLRTRRQPTQHEIRLTRRVVADISRIVPSHLMTIRPQVTSLVLGIVQFTSHMLNQPQDARKALPFLGAMVTENGKPVVEDKLRDALCTWLIAASLSADPEPQAVAGGRADIRVTFPEAVFYIEVKRVLTQEDDERASAHYGDQAAQYAVTSAPITFLALLDYGFRNTRLDLETVIWTTPHTLPGVASPYALTGLRIQANVATPSAATRSYRARAPQA